MVKKYHFCVSIDSDISFFMTYFLFFFYTLAIHLGNIYIYLGRLFSPKLESLYFGRKQTWSTLETFSKNHHKPCWIHCASLGEFEQGRPLIEKMKMNYPKMPIILSFFSASGYEIMKHYDRVDAVIYLPSDLPSNNKKLIQLIDPSMVIFVKYEFWWNLLGALTRKDIKIFLVSAVFRNGNYFFSTIFRPFLDIIGKYQHIFVQDNNSSEILAKNNIINHTIAGDTRVDRVIQRSKSAEVTGNIITYCASKTTIVYGSVWMTDMAVVLDCIKRFPDMVHILAPHDISMSNIQKIRSAIPIPSDVYSDCEWHHYVMIIDNIGMLGGLYQIAKYAFVGGGFQNGIHNILEPAVFKLPVFFGPNFKKFNEALYLTNKEFAFAVDKTASMADMIYTLENDHLAYQTISEGISNYFQQNKGATEAIISAIDIHILHNYKNLNDDN